MGDKPPVLLLPIPPTLKQKLTFYVTAFFLLVCIFSAFSFLFLVPFVIEPAYTTIKMDFDEDAAVCVTASVISRRGLSNCTWTSCREGCTREIYECTQIIVNYQHPNIPDTVVVDRTNVEDEPEDPGDPDLQFGESRIIGVAAAGGYDENDDFIGAYEPNLQGGVESIPDPDTESDHRLTAPKWFYGARLFPNVKGCGYPPYLNCTLFNETFVRVGSNFSCYYSRADPGLVVSELDMRKIRMHLVYAFCLPVVSFLVSIAYLTLAYFYIYAESKDTSKCGEKSKKKRIGPGTARFKKVAPKVAAVAALTKSPNIKTSKSTIGGAKMPASIAPSTLPEVPLTGSESGVLTPVSDMMCINEDMNGIEFATQCSYSYTEADDFLSRDSLDSLAFNYSASSSTNGNLNKMMTTCILTPPGPIAQL